MGLQLLYGAALLGASVQAFVFLPQPTNPFQALPVQNGWTPRPTPPPEGQGLFKRQISLPSSYLIAPDNTCGFINGNSRSAYACLDEDMQCAFIPSSGKVPGAAGCCKGKDCSFRISCIDRSDMDDCDEDCEDDPLTLKCSGMARFCNTVIFPGGVTDYYCSARKQTSALEAETTHSRDKSRSMSTVEPTTTSTTKKSTSSTSTKKTSSSTSKSTETTSESTSETTSEATSEEPATATEPSAASTTADSDSSSATTSSTEPVTSDAPSTPVGAIVGGVLGGIALIALVIFGAVFLRQHKKKNRAMAELPPPQPFMAEPTYPNTQPPAAPYGQDSGSARMSGYAASSVANTPAHMYSTPVAPTTAGSAAAAAAAGSFNSYHNHHPSNHTGNYPEYHPSPMTTPGGSPQPQYAHQPHAPPPLPVPSYYNNSPRASQDHYRPGSAAGSIVGGAGGAGAGAGAVEVGAGPVEVGDGASWATAELPDRRSTSTPVSTYNGTIPVTPASALGPMPGEQQGSSGGGNNAVPLILQPGMGYRPYRPPGAGGNMNAGAAGSAGSAVGGNNGGVEIGVATAMVVPRKAVPTGPLPAVQAAQSAQAQGQAQGQRQAPEHQGQGQGNGQGNAAGNQQTVAVELP